MSVPHSALMDTHDMRTLTTKAWLERPRHKLEVR